MDESGCALEHPKAAKFRSNVIAGEWDRVSTCSIHIVHAEFSLRRPAPPPPPPPQANQALTDLLPLVDDPGSVEVSTQYTHVQCIYMYMYMYHACSEFSTDATYKLGIHVQHM